MQADVYNGRKTVVVAVQVVITTTNKTTVLLTDTVVDPGTVMVELGNTAITERAVFGAERFVDDTSVTKLTEVQRVTL